MTTKRSFVKALCAFLCLAAAGCGPTVQELVLVPHGTDKYTYSWDSSGAIRADAPSTNDPNLSELRTATWINEASALNQEVCAIWKEDSGPIAQEGLALRIHGDKAITVTKNVWLGATWIENFHAWTNSGGEGTVQFGTINLESELRDKPFPWHVCAQALGNQFMVKFWLPGELEPVYGDPTHGGVATIPDGWNEAGTKGVYFGHIAPNGHISYEGVTQ